ncbi:MAG: hypothetical protein VYB77_09660, partial [Planctomycetota bacterium]|nr:hypothetical protein [Planctomycetota bacterium]
SSTAGPRPKFEVVVPGDDVFWLVVLARGAQPPTPHDRVEGLLKTIQLPQSIDLDSTGQERIQW